MCSVVQESRDGGRKNGKITKLLRMFQKSEKMKSFLSYTIPKGILQEGRK